MLYKQMVQK